MQRRLLKPLSWITAIIIIVVMLNVKVSTKQGINFKVSSIKIPLYLKIIDFFDRHYNYKWTVQRIIGDSRDDRVRAIKIFKWTYENVKKAPQGYPVIDDHVWHIIVRGYGVDDQFSDVFTTLCNYAGIDAFYNWVVADNLERRIALSFVKIGDKWYVFDPYNGIYFKNSGGLADVQDIRNGNWLIEKIDKAGSSNAGIDYAGYLRNIPSIKEVSFQRVNIQSPVKRIMFEVKKFVQQR